MNYFYSIDEQIYVIGYGGFTTDSDKHYLIDMSINKNLVNNQFTITIANKKISVEGIKRWLLSNGCDQLVANFEQRSITFITDVTDMNILPGAYDIDVNEVFSRIIYGGKVWKISAEAIEILSGPDNTDPISENELISNGFEYVIIQVREKILEYLQTPIFAEYIKRSFSICRYIVYETIIDNQSNYSLFFNNHNLNTNDDNILLFNLVSQKNPFIEFATDLPFETVFQKLAGKDLQVEKKKQLILEKLQEVEEADEETTDTHSESGEDEDYCTAY